MDSSSSGSSSDSDDKDESQLKELIAQAQEKVSLLLRNVDTIAVCARSSNVKDHVIKSSARWTRELRRPQVDASPYQYDLHVELIRLFRSGGDLDGARNARNKMAEIFPLSEGKVTWHTGDAFMRFSHTELWLEWLRDELPLASMTAEACSELVNLFEKATKDYLCKELVWWWVPH